VTVLPQVIIGGILRPNQAFSNGGVASFPRASVDAAKTTRTLFTWSDVACP